MRRLKQLEAVRRTMSKRPRFQVIVFVVLEQVSEAFLRLHNRRPEAQLRLDKGGEEEHPGRSRGYQLQYPSISSSIRPAQLRNRVNPTRSRRDRSVIVVSYKLPATRKVESSAAGERHFRCWANLTSSKQSPAPHSSLLLSPSAFPTMIPTASSTTLPITITSLDTLIQT